MSNLLNTLKNYPYDCQLQYLLKEYEIANIIYQIIQWLETDFFDDDLTKIDFITFARDFCIGSDLTRSEKDAFYEALKTQGFFKVINAYLYDNDISLSSWTIYTFGKFSQIENAVYLEKAYEAYFSLKNPILTSRCLGELHWLGSYKIDDYLKQLNINGDIVSKFTLLNFWEHFSDETEFEHLLKDSELVAFLSPDNLHISKDDVCFKLFQFEQYFWRLSPKETADMTHQRFLAIASSFFKIPI